jgi:hypothetical protein
MFLVPLSCLTLQQKAFELHHRHREQSVNIFATTRMFAECLSQVEMRDEKNIAQDRPVPALSDWVRATIEFDTFFDDFNENQRQDELEAGEYNLKYQEKLFAAEYEEELMEIMVRSCS